MTLAVLLFFWLSHALPQASAQTAPAQQTQSTPAQTPPATTSQSTTTTAPTKTSAKRKKKPQANCVAASTPTGDPNNTGQSNTAPTNCPPTRRIVRQGGTSEPSIQLAGTDPTSPRDSINQMLSSTDDNLKQLSSRKLESSQLDTVNQIHQFQDQSRAALKAGDLDRARTLAWKAQSLSQELVNPQQ